MKKNTQVYLIIAAACVAGISAALLIPKLYVSETEKQAMQEQARIQAREQNLTSEVLRLGELANTTSTPAVTAVTGQNALRITPQEEGTAIVIESAALENAGFVVVFTQNNKNKSFTYFNTSSYLDRGAYALLSIAAPTKLSTKNTYVATIYKDTNGTQQFEEATDTAVLNPEGTRFEVTIPVKKGR